MAIGAAIQGGVLKGDVKNVLLLDVNPLSLGVETAGGVFTTIIPRNTTIPAKKLEVFSTAAGQPADRRRPRAPGRAPHGRGQQDPRPLPARRHPARPRGVPQIEVTFDIDANGIVHVSARDLGTGKQQQIKIIASSGLTEDEIDRMVHEAEASKGDDELRKQFADLKVMADGLVYTSEKSLEEYASMLESDDVEDIKEDVDAVKEAMDGEPNGMTELKEGIDRLRAAIQRLEGSSHRIAEAMYKDLDDDEEAAND